MSPWHVLEQLPDLTALPTTWRTMLADEFLAFKTLCLAPGPDVGGLIPCPTYCGCFHRVIMRHDGTGAIGICRCQPPICPDIPMTLEEATPLEVDRPKLGNAIADALALKPFQANVGPFNTLQIGTWSRADIPVFFTIQTDRRDLQFTVAHLAAVLHDKFILLAPTSNLVTAETRKILADTAAAIFDLPSVLSLTRNGTLHPKKPPAEIFSQFTDTGALDPRALSARMDEDSRGRD